MPLSRLLILIVALFAGLHLFASRGMSRHDPRVKTGTSAIVLLSADWCGYCKALKRDLDQMGVAYQELDIDNDPAGRAAYDSVNASGVPVLFVGQDVIYGYDPERSRQLIAAAGYTLAGR